MSEIYTCIANTYKTERFKLNDIKMTERHYSFCGKNISMEFHYVDVEHAIADRITEGRLLPCKKCVSEMIKLLKKDY